MGKISCEGIHRALEDTADEIAVRCWRMQLEIDGFDAEMNYLDHHD